MSVCVCVCLCLCVCVSVYIPGCKYINSLLCFQTSRDNNLFGILNVAKEQLLGTAHLPLYLV